MKAGILNVSGYAGAELARILHRHPDVTLASATGRSAAGKRLGEVFPHLSDIDLTITPELAESVDVVFSALPHAASAERVGGLLREGARAIDISADFRLKDLEEYTRWYQVDHPCPEFVEESVFGLPELHREEIGPSRVVANPGCYSTAAILALAPAVDAGIIEPDVIVDAKSGVSGAGRGKFPYAEVNESVAAYSMDGHRHMPEIAQELSALHSSGGLSVTFLPHLVPMTRGILASCYATLKAGAAAASESAKAEVREIYSSFYEDEPFAMVVDGPPMTKHTLGNNDCVIYPTVDVRTGRLVVVSCIDNLVKGAAGQAVQNMNIMFDLEEDEGLRQLALYP